MARFATIVLATMPLALSGCGNGKSTSRDSGMGAAAVNPGGGGAGVGGAGGVLGTDTPNGSGGWTSGTGGDDAGGGSGGTTFGQLPGADAGNTGGSTSSSSIRADAGINVPTDGGPATDAALDRIAGGGRCQALRVAPERKNVRLRVVDLDGDGNLDVVSADSNGVVTIHSGTGGRGFEAPESIPIAPTILSFLSVGHLDGDGHLDLAVAGDTDPFILLSTGPGRFRPVLQAPGVGTGPSVPRIPSDIDIVDLDNDGNADVVVADFYGSPPEYVG